MIAHERAMQFLYEQGPRTNARGNSSTDEVRASSHEELEEHVENAAMNGNSVTKRVRNELEEHVENAAATP